MNILQLTKKFIAPIKDGESLAIASLSRGLHKEGCTVSLMALNTKKHYSDASHDHPDLKQYSRIKTIDIDTDVKWADALLHFIYGKSYNIARYYSDRFENELIQTLKKEKYDVVILETLYMLGYIDTIRKHSESKIIFRSHNLESEIWKDLSKSSKGLKKFYFNHCAEKLLDYEKSKLGTYDLLVPISKQDFEKYRRINSDDLNAIIPVGIDLYKYKSKFEKTQSLVKLGYIGSLDWKPNLEGLIWFFESMWAKLKSKFPDLEFHLAGRNLGTSLNLSSYKDVIYHGEVDSAIDFLSDLDIVIVPLLSGSGIRVKILESMAMGKIVLATEKALEGIPIEQNKNAFVFNDVEDIMNALNYLNSSELDIGSIQENAMNLIQDNFGDQALAKKLKLAMQEIL